LFGCDRLSTPPAHGATARGREHLDPRAIQSLAPVCPHCDCRGIGHGVQHIDTIFCCVYCAKHEGVKGLVDRD